MKKGGVVVWVVGDETIDGCETGTSFKQALYFKEIGFNIHDTMIYEKSGISRPSSNRCHQAFEYMFVLSKGKPKIFNSINDRLTLYPSSGRASIRQKDGSLLHKKNGVRNKKYGGRSNIWRYKTGKGLHTKDKIAYKHSAIFPEDLARDHIYMWSKEGDIVLDPFNGSGTTSKMAYLMYRRYIGIDCSREYCDITEKRIKMHKNERRHNDYWKILLNPLEKEKYGLSKYFKK